MEKNKKKNGYFLFSFFESKISTCEIGKEL